MVKLQQASKKPDVNNNQLLKHENSKVNIVNCLVEKCKNEVHEMMMPLEALFKDIFEARYVSYEYLDSNIRYKEYDESKHCIFHQGVIGHVVQQCCKFRSKVQPMDSKILIVQRTRKR